MKVTLLLCLLAATLHVTSPRQLTARKGILLPATHFPFKFYREADIQKPGKNIFFSPVSISTAFALLALGSIATSWAQVLEGLAFNLSRTQEEEKIQRAFIISSSSFWTTLLVRCMVSCNFQNSTEAKKEIDVHIKSKPHVNVNQILQDLDQNTLLVIVNYIYFKGKSHRRYLQQYLSFTYEFYKAYFDRKLSCEVVQIAYKEDVTALFILPDEGIMKQLEDALRKDTVSQWKKSLVRWRIEVYNPKPSTSSTYDLKMLMNLDVTNVFSEWADLSGITGKSDLKVSKVILSAETMICVFLNTQLQRLCHGLSSGSHFFSFLWLVQCCFLTSGLGTVA
uniref:Serpin domain-containing protein n=1 Tax=Melopsittacus undulatus TaxID=13146 RepID=A0A8V5FLL7_MELUD